MNCSEASDRKKNHLSYVDLKWFDSFVLISIRSFVLLTKMQTGVVSDTVINVL